MKGKNASTISYLRQNDVFADLVNYVAGNNIITDIDTLVEKDPIEIVNIPMDGLSSVISGKMQGKGALSMEKIRDILKLCEVKTDGKYMYILFGIESQSDIHYALPVRNMLYDAINYHRQVKDIASVNRKNKNLKSGAEYLSGFRSDDRIIPVITITMYWGSDEWNGPRCLKDMFEIEDECVAALVQDYSINLVVPREIEDMARFDSSLKEVVEYIQNADNKEGLQELLKDERYKHMERSALLVLQELGYWKNELGTSEEGSEVDMCKAWDENMAEREAIGEERGRTEGRLEGRNSMVETMLKCRELLSKIVMYSGFSEVTVREIARRIGVDVVEE